MSASKELSWKDLTAEEKEAAKDCGRLANPEDFNYHRILGELYATDDNRAYILTVDVQYAEQYPDQYFGADDDEDALATRACLIPVTTDVELEDESVIAKEYIGVDSAHVTDFSVGF